MEYKILEANGIENENIDGAAFNNFSAGNRDGIIAGILNECNIYGYGNSIEIATGELLIKGFRVKLTEAFTHTLASAPAYPINYHIVARITLNLDRSVFFEIVCREVVQLIKNNLFDIESGTYEAEIATFTHTNSGVQNLKRTIDTIIGGGNSGGGITQNQLDSAINQLKRETQPLLTFDTTPTLGSTNPVTSSGIANAVEELRTAISIPSPELYPITIDSIQDEETDLFGFTRIKHLVTVPGELIDIILDIESNMYKFNSYKIMLNISNIGSFVAQSFFTTENGSTLMFNLSNIFIDIPHITYVLLSSYQLIVISSLDSYSITELLDVVFDQQITIWIRPIWAQGSEIETNSMPIKGRNVSNISYVISQLNSKLRERLRLNKGQ